MTTPLRILFVCTANISRSPYLELRARQSIPGVEFASAGTHNFEGQPMDPAMAVELVERGDDPSKHRSRRLTGDLIRQADLVLCAQARHRQFVLEEWPGAALRVFTLTQFVDAAEKVPPDHPLLVASAYQRRGPTRTSEDIADPFGKGQELARATAAQLDSLIDRLARILEARS